MQDYLTYGRKQQIRLKKLLAMENLSEIPSEYQKYMQLDHWLRKQIAMHLPLVLSDNYEHFMACLPGKKYAGQHLLIRKQIGGFTVACGFWKWLEFLSTPMTRASVELTADFFAGRHNQFPRQFNKDYWLHVVDDFGGYLPIVITYPGEGTTFTGVPFPIAEIYGEKPAVWLNEPLFIQAGHLSHVATIAAQFAEILGDPWRFIDVMFRALHNKEESDDVLLAMLIGGGIISTSNDAGAFINGSPFKSSGTTGHCYYQQYDNLHHALTSLLDSPLGSYTTVLLDVFQHEHGFSVLQDLLAKGHTAPFAIRPDSGDTLQLGMHDLTVLQDEGQNINIVFEDGYTPADVQRAEVMRKQYGLDPERAFYGAGSAFMGPRRSLEAAYKACYFHNGTVENPEDVVETMKICLDDKMKQSIPGRINWFLNQDSMVYMLGCSNEAPPKGYEKQQKILYDGLSNPGRPYFNPEYDPQNLAQSKAVQDAIANVKATRHALGPDFVRSIGENRSGVAMTKCLRMKRKQIHLKALEKVAVQHP